MRKYSMFILSIFFILILCGCSRKSQDVSPVPSPESELIRPTVQPYNRFENLHGEDFLFALVDDEEAFISRHYNGYPDHKGVDIVAEEGKKIYAAYDGVVSRAVEMSLGYGNHIIIDHSEYRTLYAHCSELLVKEGEEVKQGDLIALIGNSGNSTGPHLHFEVIDIKTKEKINPLDIL